MRFLNGFLIITINYLQTFKVNMFPTEVEMPLKKVSESKTSRKSNIPEEKTVIIKYIKIGDCYEVKLQFVYNIAQFLHTKVSVSSLFSNGTVCSIGVFSSLCFMNTWQIVKCAFKSYFSQTKNPGWSF